MNSIDVNPDALHGMHIHAFGDLRGLLDTSLFGTIGKNVVGGLTVGGHFDPYNTGIHRCPDDSGVNPGSHSGDLGNWTVSGGSIDQTKVFTGISLNPALNNSIIGRAIVLHALTDNCQATNSSGGRLATGVIGITNPGTDTNSAAAYAAANTQAICVLAGTTACTGTYCGISNSGFIYFVQAAASITITAKVLGITNERGFHIHSYGDLSSTAGDNTGGHWNPLSTPHGLPGQATLHLGDLGSIKTFSTDTTPPYGIYQNTFNYPVGQWTLDDIIGRGIIVHAELDHGNEISCVGSDKNGAAGARVFQCAVGILNTANQNDGDNVLPSISINGSIFDNTWVNVPCAAPPPPNSGSISPVSLLFIALFISLSILL